MSKIQFYFIESEESELEGDDIDLIKQNLDIDDNELEKVGIIKVGLLS